MTAFGPSNSIGNQNSIDHFMYDAIAAGIYGQNGILGVLLDGNVPVPGVQIFALKGVLINGKPYLRCEDNILLYLPKSWSPISTTVECKTKEGVVFKLVKFDVPIGTSLSASVVNTIKVDDLYESYSPSLEALLSAPGWNEIKKWLDGILSDIVLYIKQCHLNPDCVFDKVWDRLVHNFCGGDCDRDCSFNCQWWDVACHGKKIDCERLKAQCKACETALAWAKPLVKAYIVNLIAAGSSASTTMTENEEVGCRCSES
jgi:hypothetical protein